MQEQIHFYYTSDLHSHFENWPKIVSFLNQQITRHQCKGEAYFLLDNGDHLDRVHPATEALRGIGNIELLNRANYDVVTIGNNEGITLDRSELIKLYQQANFEVVCANLTSENSPDPDWLMPYKLLTTTSQVKLAVIGLTAPFTPFYQPLEWHVFDPLQSLERYLKEMKDQVDVIVLLSHLGIDQDQEIANRFQEIDVIIGGHTHHLFKKEQWMGDTILTAAGKFGNHVGSIKLTWDHDKKRLIGKQAKAVPVSSYAEDQLTMKQLNHQQQVANQLLSRTVAQLPQPLEVNWFKETLLIKQLTRTLQDWGEADLAMLNAGILIDGLRRGPITDFDIHRICPHPINPCVVSLTGQALVEVIRAGLTDDFINLQVKGFGFRGKIMGCLVYSNLILETEEDEQGSSHLVSVEIDGEPIDIDKEYKLATADMFTFGHLSPQISRATQKTFFMPEFIRDLLRPTIQQLAKML
ncbi:bifunctional metallophosphatase/5'-nucleotidase [Amphibacillus cookii]|uniref:bifunctional metallophosphatase/5'-nucleotidase n=1 Tax=Amphibacillus cookii TaxID=767787 RepID=UPI001EF8CBD8|nr:bifunctional UDP-sugar hydrolase/5'-nucleotidase [Amphibacillus cookii]MBM7541449.1 2',3'-cyclic-nucleotide 2'-phosphodiesterase (5'-nucleotidase family) [Amphibacillus cookii]